MSFVVTLLYLKTMSRWTINSFNALLEIFKHALPSKALVPKSFADVKKLIWDFGFKSKKNSCLHQWLCPLLQGIWKFDGCPNQNCKEPRYKFVGSRVPCKVLHYFPLKPRITMVICPQRNRMETKGYHACPICMGETTCVHLLHQKKLC